jgi:hypothetical protein
MVTQETAIWATDSMRVSNAFLSPKLVTPGQAFFRVGRLAFNGPACFAALDGQCALSFSGGGKLHATATWQQP